LGAFRAARAKIFCTRQARERRSVNFFGTCPVAGVKTCVIQCTEDGFSGDGAHTTPDLESHTGFVVDSVCIASKKKTDRIKKGIGASRPGKAR